MNDFVDAALAYQARGWRVIPLHRVGPDGLTCSCRQGRNCTSKGKHPIDNEWQKKERLSTADIHATWDVKLPPNIGIATGVDSGVWVLDIDPEHGGMETMAALAAQHGALPPTFVAQTGSGGYHYFFTLPPDFEVKNDQSGHVGQGLDVRGKGGQVVAAPSRSNKGVYTVIVGESPTSAPDWLLALARKEEHAVDIVTADDLPKPDDLDEQTWKRLTAYAQRAIDSELERLDKLKVTGWSGEPWNHTTFEVSCSLIEFANSPWCAYSLGQAARDVLTRTPRDSDGFDDYTVQKTFNSAREKVGPKARAMPEDRRPREAEPDPMFTGPDVVRRDPSEDGGATTANPGRPDHNPGRYFGGNRGTEALRAEMASGVMEFGPVGYGRDEDFWRYEHGVWIPDGKLVTDRLVWMLDNSYKRDFVGSVSDIVRTRAQYLDCEPVEQLLNFGNTMLDWRTLETCEHDAKYGSTVQLGCDWEPDAECPRFDAFLADILHPDYVALAWEMLGYLMYSGNPLQVAFLFYGSGQNGKGTLMRVIEQLLGKPNIASESLDDLNGNRFSSINLFGRIANLAGDIDKTYQESTANFKKITGEDTIGAERKFGQRFKFENWAVPVFSANDFPGSADVTIGYLRRWIVLHFHKTIQKKILGLSDDLARELPGIAAKAVPALQNLMARKTFEPTGEAKKGIEAYALAIDQVRQWLASGEVMGGPAVETELHRLYSAYSMWTERAGQRKLRETEFSNRLEHIGYSTTKVAGATFHTGLSVPETPGQRQPTADTWFHQEKDD